MTTCTMCGFGRHKSRLSAIASVSHLQGPVTLYRLTIPSEKQTCIFLKCFNSYLCSFTYGILMLADGPGGFTLYRDASFQAIA